MAIYWHCCKKLKFRFCSVLIIILKIIVIVDEIIIYDWVVVSSWDVDVTSTVVGDVVVVSEQVFVVV